MYINQCQSQQHFPTPHEVSMRMRSLITQKISRTTTVLDPSAGNGILLEVFDIGSFNLRFDRSQSKRIKSFNLFAIEIDNELRMILNEKGFGVLGTDFLAFRKWESPSLNGGFIKIMLKVRASLKERKSVPKTPKDRRAHV